MLSRAAEERDGNEKLGRRSRPCPEHDMRMCIEWSVDRDIATVKFKYRDPKQHGDQNGNGLCTKTAICFARDFPPIIISAIAFRSIQKS